MIIGAVMGGLTYRSLKIMQTCSGNLFRTIARRGFNAWFDQTQSRIIFMYPVLHLQQLCVLFVATYPDKETSGFCPVCVGKLVHSKYRKDSCRECDSLKPCTELSYSLLRNI